MPAKKSTKKAAQKTTKTATKKISKPVTKKTTKKVAKKTSRTRTKPVVKRPTKATPKALVYASDQECFWMNDGQILDTLGALKTALQTMPSEVYKEHVTADKNDFADWVEHVLKDTGCARALRSAKTPKSAALVVGRHLKAYQL